MKNIIQVEAGFKKALELVETGKKNENGLLRRSGFDLRFDRERGIKNNRSTIDKGTYRGKEGMKRNAMKTKTGNLRRSMSLRVTPSLMNSYLSGLIFLLMWMSMTLLWSWIYIPSRKQVFHSFYSSLLLFLSTFIHLY